MAQHTQRKWHHHKSSSRDTRVEMLRYGAAVLAGLIILRLLWLQVVKHDHYQDVATGQHALAQELLPERGTVYVQDLKDRTLVPIATNQRLAFVWADPRRIEDPKEAAEIVGKTLEYSEEEIESLEERLDKPLDPYEPIKRYVPEGTLQRILEHDLSGIGYTRELTRYYPEPALGGHVVGFLGQNEDGEPLGQYGIEGYFDEELSGTQGFLKAERDIAGRIISVANREIEPATDGTDIVLTIDRTIQFTACQKLKEAVERHDADGGSVVILEPSTGNVLAMCGVPDFNPGDYRNVESISAFNNPTIFNAYEPGSIFKPLTMAAALDVGAVEPMTFFEDTGSVMVDGWHKPIGNAEGKVYGEVTMTQVLEDSINTGMIFSMRSMGIDAFTQYVHDFGFGEPTGIEINKERVGDISSLDIGAEIYAATASFGQGISVTPLQIASAYAALANGGHLMKANIIDELRYPDGTIEHRQGEEIRQVIKEKTARQIGAMMISVIDHGHGAKAGVPGYYIAGKTGTAQVARTDGIGYSEDNTIGSFAGFGPVEDPRFAMVVRIDHPKDVVWAEATAAPLFGDIAEFLINYFEIPPSRDVE